MKEGWEMKKLGDIGKISMCKRVFKNQTSQKGEIPFYKIGTFGKKPNAYISKELYDEYRGKYSFPKKGNILLSASGTIGRRVIYDGKPAYFQDSNIVWIDNNEKMVLNEYLYIFYGFCDWNPSRGATISRLYNDDLRNIRIPIPPLPEQKQIVSLLDQAFAAIDQAKANVEKNIANAKELFQSKLNAIFSQEGEGWEEVALSEITTTISDGDHMAPPKTDKGIPFITISNINKDNNQIDFSKTFFVPKEYYDDIKESRKPRKGDVLYTVTGSFGIPVLIDFSKEFCFQRHIGLIRPTVNTDPKWLYYWILSPQSIKQANDKATGTAQRTVSLRSLRNFIIPKVPYEEQLNIVKRLDVISTEINNNSTLYQKKIDSLNNLKKSLLQKAFSGELTAKEISV